MHQKSYSNSSKFQVNGLAISKFGPKSSHLILQAIKPNWQTDFCKNYLKFFHYEKASMEIPVEVYFPRNNP